MVFTEINLQTFEIDKFLYSSAPLLFHAYVANEEANSGLDAIWQETKPMAGAVNRLIIIVGNK